MSKLTISDLKFDITSAILKLNFVNKEEAAPKHRLAWGVLVEAEQKAGDQKNWQPSFTGKRLLETKPKDVRSWQQLAGRGGSWAEDDNERGVLYTFSHERVINVTWRFGQAASGRLTFTLDGFSEIRRGDGYDGLLPIHIDTELDFARVPMRNDSKLAAKKRLVQFGLEDPFDFVIEDGVSFLIPTGYPHP